MLLAESIPLQPRRPDAATPRKYASTLAPPFTRSPTLICSRGGGVQQDIDSRTKFDQADAFSALHPIADFLVENDPARQQSRDLLEHHGLPVALDRDHILLVVLGRCRVHGVQKLSLLIANIADHPRHRRTIHVHIKDAEKNADPGVRNAIHQNGRHVGNFAIGREKRPPRRSLESPAPDRGKTTGRTAPAGTQAGPRPAQPASP